MFDTARELAKRNALERFITSYPVSEARKYDIEPKRIRSIIIKELLWRSWSRCPSIVKSIANPQFFIHDFYDRVAARYLVDADIVMAGSSMGLHTLRKARTIGNPVVVIDHGSTHIQYQDEMLREEYLRLGIPPMPWSFAHPRIIEKELQEYQEADYILIPSTFVQNTFIQKGIRADKLILIPYGVNLSMFHPAPKWDGVFRIIFAGGICIRKGVHYLLQAFHELDLPNAELLLIGPVDSEMQPFLKQYSGCYRLIGKIPQRELYTYYSQGSVFCILSIEEGLALVQAQAMACGLPVIATTNTGAEDIIRDGIDGYIIPIRDVQACKEKLLYLYENQDVCTTMGESAQQRVSTGFTWDDYGTRMITAYERILKR